MYPNNIEATYLARACGVARFAYNWALAEWKRLYGLGEKVSEGDLRKKLNGMKRESFPWMLEVTKCAPQLAIKDLGAAFKNFFEGRAGWPQFKRKGRHESFRISNDQFAIEGKSIRIPNLGWVKLAEPLRWKGKILGATVSRRAEDWFVAVQVEMPEPVPVHAEGGSENRVDVRLDEKCFAMLTKDDQEEIVQGPKEHKALLKRLERLERSLARKGGARRRDRKSRNTIETKKKVARLCVRVANIRQDALHKLTTKLAREQSFIRVENRKPPRELKGREIPRSTRDMSVFEFRRQLEYKARITGSTVRFKNQSDLKHAEVSGANKDCEAAEKAPSL
jgi:putative transposase